MIQIEASAQIKLMDQSPPSAWNGAYLKQLPQSRRRNQLPDFLKPIIDLAVSLIDVDRIWLYGSRARGDHRENSDYDLAFDFKNASNNRWPQFVADVGEGKKTLLPVELLNINECPKKLKDKVIEEGILLYEKAD